VSNGKLFAGGELYFNNDDRAPGLVQLGPPSADFDGDGQPGTRDDVTAFFRCLAGDCCYGCQEVDFDGDGDPGTDKDIEAFFRALAGGLC
jgi:hypothetical protein